MAALSYGWRELYPHAHKLALNDSLYTLPTPEPTESPLKLLVGHFDLPLVVLSLYSLGIIGSTFSMMDAEQEMGLLGLLLSNPVPYRQSVSGKLLGRAVLMSAAGAIITTTAL